MNIVTVIPARGGSKSIPRKNIIQLGGHPLIKYSIDYSIKCDLIARTIVSTDDEEIASISKLLGAEVPFIRPFNLAQDETPDFPVLLHALHEIESMSEDIIDVMVLLRPTSPLRPQGLIEKGISLLSDNPDATSVRAVAKTKEHPFRQWVKNNEYIDGFIKDDVTHEPFNIPRQFLPDLYFQTGDIEIVRRKTIIDGSVSGSRVVPLFIDSEQVNDIDHIKDLKIAERKIINEKS
jgi:CMP-N,N'-diacetyllegionaminic acid synthase